MRLPSHDLDFLTTSGVQHEVVEDGGMLCVVLKDFALPPGLSHVSADILFRLPALYPEAPPDMWWISPALTTTSGGRIQATESIEQYLGRTWQRWSRHLPPNSWNSVRDGLDSWVRLLRTELLKAGRAAA